MEAPRRDGDVWRKVHKRYLRLVMAEGKQVQDEAGRIVSKGVTPEEFEAGAPELLRHRIGYSVHGLALGSAAYMESVSEKIGGDSE